jgi:hypothetical protein
MVTSFTTPVDRGFSTRAFEGIDEAGWKRLRVQLLGGAPRPGDATIEEA